MQFEPVAIEERNSKHLPSGVYDFGRDAFARFYLEYECDTANDVELVLGEVLKDGRINREPGGSRTCYVMTCHLEAGKGRVDFEFPKHGQWLYGQCMVEPELGVFRYVEVNGCLKSATPVRTVLHAPFDDAASEFHCSDATLEKIWEFCKYSIKATSVFGVFVDGERERLPYEGDAYINGLGWVALSSDYAILRRSIDALFLWPTWPTEWHLILCCIIRIYYLYSGDIESVLRWYTGLQSKLMLDYLVFDHPLSTDGNKNPRDLIDWPMTERDGYVLGKYNFVPNALLVHTLREVAALAEEIGKVQDAKYYRFLATDVKARMDVFFKKGEWYVDSEETDHVSLHTAVAALHFGIADKADWPKYLELIRSKGMACSVFYAQFLMDMLYQFGCEDYALSLLTSTEQRSWYNMMAKGATITMEAWDDCFKPNQDWNHAWGAVPANIVGRRIFGIRPVKAGFREVVIDLKPGSLKEGFYKHPTPHGPITVEFCNGKKKVTLPDGVQETTQVV
ncbi:MAG: hypothetical protein IJT83_06140 [Victivallales bacterium]|nr:hypothetical protein [Victivallales bacterium]